MLNDACIFYIIIDAAAIVILAIYFSYRLTFLEKQVDEKLEVQQENMMRKIIGMFKKAFEIIKKSVML